MTKNFVLEHSNEDFSFAVVSIENDVSFHDALISKILLACNAEGDFDNECTIVDAPSLLGVFENDFVGMAFTIRESNTDHRILITVIPIY